MAIVESWKKVEKIPDRDWTRYHTHGLDCCASHSMQGSASSWVAERLHTVCKAQCLREWQRGFTQCARPSVFVSGREASHSLNNACGGLSELQISGGSLRVPNLVFVLGTALVPDQGWDGSMGHSRINNFRNCNTMVTTWATHRCGNRNRHRFQESHDREHCT